MTDEIKNDSVIDLDQGISLLYNNGLLFAINREILHPFGLAIGVKVEDDGKISGGVLFDHSNNHNGMNFDPPSLIEGAIKYNKFLKETGASKKEIRRKNLGYILQPIQFDLPFIDNINGEAQVVKTEKETTDPVPKNEMKITNEGEKKKISGRGAAVRHDLVSTTQSFSSKINSIVGPGGEEVDIDNISDTPSTRSKIDVSKLKVANKTKYTDNCSHPQENIVSEHTSGGGTFLFCSLCGAQFRDSDLNDNT